VLLKTLRPSVTILSKTVSVDRCIGLAVEHRAKWLNRCRSFCACKIFFPAAGSAGSQRKFDTLLAIRFASFPTQHVPRFHPYPSRDLSRVRNRFLYFLYVKPTDNAFVESFNGTLRAECLDAHWFATLAEAKQLIELWRREY
jgi:hypothetical protein